MADILLVGSNIQLTPTTQTHLPPCEGYRAAPFLLDFNVGADYLIDFTQPQQNKQFTTIQTVYVDNSLNTSDLVIAVEGTQQRQVVPKNTCGYFVLVAPTPTKVRLSSSGAFVIPVQFLNYYIPPTVWAVAP
jgi:hypothetical protein